MAEWFDERYISRIEHQQIVDYYKNIVVQLHRKVRELRAAVEMKPPDSASPGGFGPAGPPPLSGALPRRDYGGNVVSLDSWRRAHGPSAAG